MAQGLIKLLIRTVALPGQSNERVHVQISIAQMRLFALLLKAQRLVSAMAQHSKAACLTHMQHDVRDVSDVDSAVLRSGWRLTWRAWIAA